MPDDGTVCAGGGLMPSEPDIDAAGFPKALTLEQVAEDTIRRTHETAEKSLEGVSREPGFRTTFIEMHEQRGTLLDTIDDLREQLRVAVKEMDIRQGINSRLTAALRKAKPALLRAAKIMNRAANDAFRKGIHETVAERDADVTTLRALAEMGVRDD